MWDWVGKLAELKGAGTPVAVVTVVGGSGSTPRESGAKMLVLADGTFFGTVGGGHLEQLALEDARRLLAGDGDKSGDKSVDNRESRRETARVIRYPLGAKTGQCCGGVVELLFETLGAGPRLYLFGAGHVGQAVARTLAGTPFVVHAVDEREEWISSSELPPGVVRHRCEWDDFVEEAEWNSHSTYVAIMTHRHDLDQDIVAGVLRRPVRYIGLIGSHGKWARFRQRLDARGFSQDELARVRCPLGVDTGGKAPQEVAISVAAELLRVHYGRERST